MKYKETRTCLDYPILLNEDQKTEQVHGLFSSKLIIALYKQTNENVEN